MFRLSNVVLTIKRRWLEKYETLLATKGYNIADGALSAQLLMELWSSRQDFAFYMVKLKPLIDSN